MNRPLCAFFAAGTSLFFAMAAAGQNLSTIDVASWQQEDEETAYTDSGELFDCDCCVCWTGSVGAVVMNRTNPDADGLLTLVPGGPPEPECVFDYEPGFELSLRRTVPGCCRDVEVRYMQIDEWQEVAQPMTFAGGVLNIATNPPTPITLGGPSTVGVDFRADFRTLEVSMGRQVSDCVRTFAGFRWAQSNENVDITISNPSTLLSWDVDNNLYGFQGGIQSVLWEGCRLNVEGLLKAGVYLNDVEQMAFQQRPVGTLLGTGNADDTVVAFLGELGISGVYTINCNTSLRAGYQLMWLDGVATGTSQVRNTGNLNLANAGATIDSDTVFYHGASFLVQIDY